MRLTELCTYGSPIRADSAATSLKAHNFDSLHWSWHNCSFVLTFENRSPNCVTRDKSSTKLTEVFQACLWPEKHFYMLPASGTSRKQTNKNFSKRLLGRSFQIKSNYNRIQLWPLGSFGNQHFLWHEFEPRNCIDNFSRLNYFLPSPLAAFDYLVFLVNSFNGRLAFIFLLFRGVLECSAH